MMCKHSEDTFREFLDKHKYDLEKLKNTQTDSLEKAVTEVRIIEINYIADTFARLSNTYNEEGV